jgi:tape measure domain-containing protein
MSYTLGDLILELKLDPTTYYAQLDQARSMAARVGTEIEQQLNLGVKANPQSFANLHRGFDSVGKHYGQTGNLMQSKPLVTKVDDRELTRLNQHLDKKQAHWEETVRLFGRKPIRPSFDGSGMAEAEAELDEAIERQKNAQIEINGSEIRPVIAPLHNKELQRDLQIQQADLDARVAYFEQNPIVIKVDTSALDAATEKLNQFQANYEEVAAKLQNIQIKTTPEATEQSHPQYTRGEDGRHRDSAGRFVKNPYANQQVNVTVEQPRQGVGEKVRDKAQDVVIDQILAKTLAPAVDMALEEGFTQVLKLTSKILKEQFGGIQFLGVGKVLSKEVDQLRYRTQKKYAPEEGISGRVEKAKGQFQRNVVEAPAKVISAPIRGVMKGFYEAIGGVYGERFGTGSADRVEKGMGRSISDLGEKSGKFADKITGLDAINGLINKIGKLNQLEAAVKPIAKKYRIDFDADSVQDKVMDGLLAYADRLSSILNRSLDESKIEGDIDSVKNALMDLGKAIVVTNDKAAQAQALQELAEKLEDIVVYPRAAVIDTYKQGAKESAKDLSARMESEATPIEKLDDHIRRVAFVSAGFSATEGKQSHNMAAEVAKYAGDDVKIVPFENREFEVTKDAAADGVAAWILDVLNTVSGTIEKGYNPSAVRMAAEAYQYKMANPEVDIDLVGHSAGGLIAKEAQEILKHLGVDSRTLAMGTPNVGAFQSNTPTAEGLMGVGDVMQFISDQSSLTMSDAAGHEFPKYAEDPEVRRRLAAFLNAPTRKGENPAAKISPPKPPEIEDPWADDTSPSTPQPPNPPPVGGLPSVPTRSSLSRKVVDEAFRALNQPVPSETKAKVREGYKRAAEEIKTLVDEGLSEFEVIEPRAGFRTTEAAPGQKYTLDNSDLPRAATQLGKVEAEQLTFFVGGFGGVNGLESEYLGQELSKNLPKHHVVGVESPEFDVKPEAGQTVAHPAFLKKAYDTIVDQAAKEGDNTAARRMAERAYAYHKANPDLPINLVGQSGGSMVARAAGQILKEMGVPNVRVAATAGPHFGASDQAGMTMASKQDPFRTIAGPLMSNLVEVDSVPAHSKYYNSSGAMGARDRFMQVDSGEVQIEVNPQVEGALNAFFDRSVDEQTALENARKAAQEKLKKQPQKSQPEFTPKQLELLPPDKQNPIAKQGKALIKALEEAIDPGKIQTGVEEVKASFGDLVQAIATLDAAAQSESLKNLGKSIQGFGKTPTAPPDFKVGDYGQLELFQISREYKDTQLELFDVTMKPIQGLTPQARQVDKSPQLELFDADLEPKKFRAGNSIGGQIAISSKKQFAEIGANMQEGFEPAIEAIDGLGDAMRETIAPVKDAAKEVIGGIASKAASDAKLVGQTIKKAIIKKPKQETSPTQIDSTKIAEQAEQIKEAIDSTQNAVEKQIDLFAENLQAAQEEIESAQAKVSPSVAPKKDTSDLQKQLQQASKADLTKIAKSLGIKGISKDNKTQLAEKIAAENPEAAKQMLREKDLIAGLLEIEKKLGAKIAAANKLKGDTKTKRLEELRQEAIGVLAQMNNNQTELQSSVYRAEHGGIKGRFEQKLKTNLAITSDMIASEQSRLQENPPKTQPRRSTASASIDDIEGLARVAGKTGFLAKLKGVFQAKIDDAAQKAIDELDNLNESLADVAFAGYADAKSGKIGAELKQLAEQAKEEAVQLAIDQINNIDADIADAARAINATLQDGSDELKREMANQARAKFERLADAGKEQAGKYIQVEPDTSNSVGVKFTPTEDVKKQVEVGRKRIQQAVQIHGIWKRKFTKNLEKNYTEFANQVAQASGVEMKPGDMPRLVVDDKRLKKLGVQALYDIKTNRVIVSKELAKALDRDASQLGKYEEELKAIAHELRHAAQFDFGKKKISDIAAGKTGFGVKITPEQQASGDAARRAEASVEAVQKQARRKNKYEFSASDRAALKAAEVDAYHFEGQTGKLIQNVTGNLKAQSKKDFAAIAGYAKQAAEMMVSHFAQRFPGLTGIINGMVEKFQGIPLKIFQGFVAIKVFEWLGRQIPQIAAAAVDAAQRFEKLGLKMAFVSGSAAAAQRNFAMIRSESVRLGTDLEAATGGFVGISAAAKGGGLEGAGAESIFKALNQASSVYQLDSETQGRAFVAVQQMISKGASVSSEELKQQLGEALPGTIQIAARAAGKSTGEFTKMLEQGNVLVEDFLPKFANQLAAETSTGVAGAADTAQASLNRLNSTMTELKVRLGTPLLEVQKNAFKAFNAVLQVVMPVLPLLTIGIGVGLAKAAYVGAAAVFNFATGMSLSAVLGKAFSVLLSALPALFAKIGAAILGALPLFLAFQGALDAIGAVGKVFKNAGQEAKDATDQIGEFNRKFNEMKGIKNDSGNLFMNVIDNVKSGKGLTGIVNSKQDSALGDTAVGKIVDFVLGKGATTTGEQIIQKTGGAIAQYSGAQSIVDTILGGVNKGLGTQFEVKFGSTFAEKKHNDFLVANRDFEFTASETRDKAYSMFDAKTGQARGSLKGITDIDAQLQELNARRRVIRPGQDVDKRTIDKQINDLRAQRESVSKEASAIQGQLATQIQSRTNLIKGLKEYRDSGQVTGDQLEEVNSQIKIMEFGIEEDRKALDKFNKVLGHSADEARRLKEAIEDIDFDTQGRKRNLDARLTQQKTDLSSRLVGAAQGSREQSFAQLELQQLDERTKLNKQLIDRYRDMLNSAESRRTLSIAGVDGDSPELQGAQLRKAAARMSEGQEKTNLDLLADAIDKMKDLEVDTANMGQQIAEARHQATEKLRENTKSVADFYRNIDRQAKEAALDAKLVSREITGMNAKNRLKSALSGLQNDYISEFVDGLVGLIDAMNEPFKTAIEAQKQEMGKINQLNDTLRQQQEQARQLPTGYEGMGLSPQTAQAVGAYGKDPSGIADNTIRVVRTGKKDEHGGEILEAQLIRGGKVVDSVKAASGVASNQTFEVAGRNRQGAGSYAPIPEGMYKLGAVEKTRGSFGEGLGNTWVDILDAQTGSSSISGTGRGAFGLHLDANRFAGAPGSAGCVVFYDQAATNRVADWVKGGARKMQVDWGLGTFSRGIQAPTAANKILPTPRSQSSPGAIGYEQVMKMMEGGSNSDIAKLVGMAEGNRRADGSYTKHAYGHTDPGNYKHNIGSFSAQGDFNRGSIAASDQVVIDELLRPNIKRLYAAAQKAGVAVTPKLMMNFIDTANQGGQAVATGWSDGKSTGKGFLGKLSMIRGKENDDSALRELRMESYRNDRGRMEVAQVFRDRSRFAEDQDRRMSKINKAISVFGVKAQPTANLPAPGVMMPTTGMSQGDVQEQERIAKEYSRLHSKLNEAGQQAIATTQAEIENIRKMAEAQRAGQRIAATQKGRQLDRQLKRRGTEQYNKTRASAEALMDQEDSLGFDTPDKAYRQDQTKLMREFRDKREDSKLQLEDIRDSYGNATRLIALIREGGLGPEIEKRLPLLEQQQRLLAKQLEIATADDNKMEALYQKLKADKRMKAANARFEREFTAKQQLSQKEIESFQSESSKLKIRAETVGIGPYEKDNLLMEAAKRDRVVGRSQARNKFDAGMEELRKQRLADPNVYNTDMVKRQRDKLTEILNAELENVELTFKNAVETLQYADVQRTGEKSLQQLKSSVELLRQQAEELNFQAADEALQRNNPLKVLDLKQQSLKKTFESSKQELEIGLEEFIRQQQEAVRGNQQTKESAALAIEQYKQLNDVKLTNLTTQLEQQTAELTRQREELEAQSKARVFESTQQTGAERVKYLREFQGKGLEAIDLQKQLDLEKIEVDLQVNLRSLELDKSILPEAKAKIRDNLKQQALMRSNETTRNADLATEENTFQVKTAQFQSALSMNNARGNLARSFGFEWQGRQADKAAAIAQENYNLADGLRKIDEQARQLGMAPEVVEQLKNNLQSLNEINLQNINAQFNPLVEGLKGVKGAFQGFLGDIISGNETIGDAFNKMVDSILNSLSNLAAQLITEQLFGSLFGLGKGIGGGGLGGIFSSIFGFADGGEVPAVNHSALRDRPDAIGQALRKEGPNSVLAAVTPGERVITKAQNRWLEGLGLSRFLSSANPSATMAKVSATERTQKVYNFAMGGVVPGANTPAVGANPNAGSQYFNIPITIEGGGNNAGINIPKMTDAIKMVVKQQLREERRPRNELS